jgi:hypothetical protein
MAVLIHWQSSPAAYLSYTKLDVTVSIWRAYFAFHARITYVGMMYVFESHLNNTDVKV